MTMMIQAIRLTRKKGRTGGHSCRGDGRSGGADPAAGAARRCGVRQSSPVFPTTERGWHICGTLGWEIDPEPLTTLQFLLPPKLSGDYITYNDLQKSQGFDLETCCGKQVTGQASLHKRHRNER